MPLEVTFEFMAEVTSDAPFLLCHCCGQSIPPGKVARCYVGGENPLYAYICRMCCEINEEGE